MKQIWALFSVDNNYDQPDNNLVAWWAEKPSFDTLAKAIGLEAFPCGTNEESLYVINLWQGVAENFKRDDTLYRFELVSEGLL